MGFEQLTARQREILKLVAEGKSNKEIAAALTISLRTVNGHISAMFERLEVHNRVQATVVYDQFLAEGGQNDRGERD